MKIKEYLSIYNKINRLQRQKNSYEKMLSNNNDDPYLNFKYGITSIKLEKLKDEIKI